MTLPPDMRPRSFDPPQEPEWHRKIAEAAYYRAQKREFRGEHSLDDWLAAEREVRDLISPPSDAATMNETTDQNDPAPDPQAPGEGVAKKRRAARKRDEPSQFAKFAATQAAADGIQGDVKKPDKTSDEKIGANMADRK